MIEETKLEQLQQKLFALDCWAHRAFVLGQLKITNMDKIKEALGKCQICLHEARKVLEEVNEGNQT